MGIKNRNVATDAKIDITKLNLLDGKRVFWEDFDDIATTPAGNFYGLNQDGDGTAANGGVAVPSSVVLSCAGDEEEIIVFGDNTWSNDKDCTVGVRITALSRVTDLELRVGFADQVVITAVIAGDDGDLAAVVEGDHDWAYVELDTGTRTDFTIRAKKTGVAETPSTKTGIVAATSTVYKITVKLTDGENVTATINDRTFRVGSVINNQTDWRPFIFMRSNGAGALTANLDAFSCHEDRT